ncbi:MAG: Signal recognition particle core component [Peltula sp. TS41687]|nr:MAG: Signal recognition particle core component [Peltula sp. TS41687]
MAATASLSALLRQTALEDHEDVLRAADAVLKKSRHDIEAQHVKVVALVKLDRFEDALRVLAAGNDELNARATLEKTYALYKLGKWEEAEHIASQAPARRALRHVQAQAAYRLEKFEKTAELYKRLATQRPEMDNEGVDLKINRGATDAQLQWSSGNKDLVHKTKPDREDLEAFETAYNAACGSITRGEFMQADIILKRAKAICTGLDDMTDEDKAAELLQISAQQIYVLLKLGKGDDASELAEQVPIKDLTDVPTRRVAQNNSMVSSLKTLNPYLAHRLFHSHSHPSSKADNPFGFQFNILQRNSYLLDLLCLKHTGVANSTSTYLSQQSLPTRSAHINLVSVINAAAHAHNKVGKAGIKAILPVLEKRPTDIGLLLTLIQLYMLTNNHGTAVNLLETFMKRLEASNRPKDQDVRFAPGLVGLMVSLFRLQGRKAQIRIELKKAAGYWRGKPKPPASLLREAGAVLLTSTEAEDNSMASEIFEDLKKQDPNDLGVIAGYIAANVQARPERITEDIRKLTPIPRLIAGIDAAALEEAGMPRLPPALSADASRKRSAEDTTKPTKKRVRKSRLPKNYDPTKPPDPERWLPLRERSSYRPKGKKGKAKVATLTQGGIGGEESLNLGGGAGVAKVEKLGTGGGSANKAKKKKGKGR